MVSFYKKGFIIKKCKRNLENNSSYLKSQRENNDYQHKRVEYFNEAAGFLMMFSNVFRKVKREHWEETG